MLGILQKFINIVLTIVEAILSIRFILLFFKVGSASSFAGWIYKASVSIVAPFGGITAPLKLGSFTIDFATLIALLAYGIAGSLILKLLAYIRRGY